MQGDLVKEGKGVQPLSIHGETLWSGKETLRASEECQEHYYHSLCLLGSNTF